MGLLLYRFLYIGMYIASHHLCHILQSKKLWQYAKLKCSIEWDE